jgi:hypothetical protein
MCICTHIDVHACVLCICKYICTYVYDSIVYIVHMLQIILLYVCIYKTYSLFQKISHCDKVYIYIYIYVSSLGFTLCQFLVEHFTIFVVMPDITTVQSLKEQVLYFILTLVPCIN